MEALGRWVRFIFAIRGFMVLIIPLYLWTVARAYWGIGLGSTPLSASLREAKLHVILANWHLPVYGCVGMVSLVAWWALRKGWPSARLWALTASVAGMFDGWLGAAVGLGGLIAFRKPVTVSKVAGKPAKQAAAAKKRVAGDGTSAFIDQYMPLVFMAGLFAARIAWAMWGKNHGLPPTRLPGLVVIAIAIHLGVLFHETGHFLAGLGSDMVLRHFQVGPLCGKIQDGRWRFSLNVAGLMGGGMVGMVPTHLKNVRGRMVLLTLGGPVASLLTGSISTLLALSAKGSPWESWWGFFAVFGTFGFLDFVANLTPARPESHYSDGAQIYQLMSNGPWAERHLARAMVASSLATSRRPRDFDEGTLVRAAASVREGEEGLYMGLFVAIHYLDSGKTEQGIAAWRAAIEQDPEAAAKLKPDTAAEMAFYEGAVACDARRAREWWDRVESTGGSRQELDYWKGNTAVLLVEGKLDQASEAFRKADELAQKLPEVGAYEFDRWCVDVLRRRLNETDLGRLAEVTKKYPVPVLAGLTIAQ